MSCVVLHVAFICLALLTAALASCQTSPQVSLEQQLARARTQARQLNEEAAALLPDQPEKAVKLLNKAQQICPDLPEVLNNLGVCHLLAGRHYEAAMLFRRAAEIDPKNADLPYNLGLVFEQSENWTMAATYFENSLKLRPDDLRTMENLARVYAKLGRPHRDIAPLAAKALQQETRQDWIAWLTKYATNPAAPDTPPASPVSIPMPSTNPLTPPPGVRSPNTPQAPATKPDDVPASTEPAPAPQPNPGPAPPSSAPAVPDGKT